MVRLLALLFLVSCGIGYDFQDNTGKCFMDINQPKYETPTIRLIFNKYDDYVIYLESSLHGPLENAYLKGSKEVECPKKWHLYEYQERKLKEYGVYDEISKYIELVPIGY